MANANANATAGAAGGGYGLGFIGALIYTMQHVSSFWDVLVGLFQSIFWPAYVVYHLFAFLNI